MIDYLSLYRDSEKMGTPSFQIYHLSHANFLWNEEVRGEDLEVRGEKIRRLENTFVYE